MKDFATMENELEYMTMELAKVKSQREFLMRFVARLLHPEEYGWLVDQEVRNEAKRILDEVQR